MSSVNRIGTLLAIFLLAPVTRGSDAKPAEELAGLKREAEAAMKALGESTKPGAPEAEQAAAGERYREQSRGLARRALALAEAHPDAPEAVEALAWIFTICDLGAECDAAYDLMAIRFLDKDALLPIARTACDSAAWTAHAGLFLRAAAERSPNLKLKALACFSLARHQQLMAHLKRLIDDPIRGETLQEMMGPENLRRVRAVDPESAKREAGALFERTLKEFADLQPMGKRFPPLGEQAQGALFRLRNLEVGCTAPEIEGEDVEGRPLRLSDFRGKVVVVAFWASWCGPCMGMVPDEKALCERMKGRPFVLLGVNGDEDRGRAKEVAAKAGIPWRSFWNGGHDGPISLKWGVTQWPTNYVIDARGVIRRDDTLRSPMLDKVVEALVAEAETARRP